MKSIYRLAAVLCVTAVLVQPTVSFARTRDDRERGISDRVHERVVRVIKLIQKQFGIASNDDIPSPPKPKP